MGGRSAFRVQGESTEQMAAQRKQGRRFSRLLAPDEVLCH